MSHECETYYEKGVLALELAEAQPRDSAARRDRFEEARAYFDAANTCLRLSWTRPPIFPEVESARPRFEGTVPRD